MAAVEPPATVKDKAKAQKLSLKGSAKLCVEFFEFATNSILFQRGVYPAEDFASVKKYGLSMTMCLDDQVKAYIKKIMGQLSKWMQKSKISKLVIVITSKETGEHVERWQLNVDVLDDGSKKKPKSSAADNENSASAETAPAAEKTDAEIQQDIRSLFRQITSSVTYLPILEDECTFNVLVYADQDSEVPLDWGDSDAKEVKNAEKVQLRSFSTNSHKVDMMVSYRLVE